KVECRTVAAGEAAERDVLFLTRLQTRDQVREPRARRPDRDRHVEQGRAGPVFDGHEHLAGFNADWPVSGLHRFVVARTRGFRGHDDAERRHGGEAREDSSHHHPPAAITLPGTTCGRKTGADPESDACAWTYPGARVRRRRERTNKVPGHENLNTAAPELYIPSRGGSSGSDPDVTPFFGE